MTILCLEHLKYVYFALILLYKTPKRTYIVLKYYLIERDYYINVLISRQRSLQEKAIAFV